MIAQQGKSKIIEPKKNIVHQIVMFSKEQQKTIVCPTYLRVNIRNFENMNFSELKAGINLQILLNIYLGKLPQKMKQAFKQKLQIYLSRDGVVKLFKYQKSNEVRGFQKNGFMNYQIRKKVSARVQPYVFFTPYELIDLLFTVSIAKIEICKDPKIYLKCNIIQLQKNQMKFNYSSRCFFGNYYISPKRIQLQYTNQRQRKSLLNLGKSIYSCKFLDYYDQNLSKYNDQPMNSSMILDQSSNCVNHVHIHIPVYHQPMVTLVTIFFPLIILGIINLAVYYQDPGLSDRISSIASLMIAFSQLIPIVRQKMPLDSKITIMEILIYLQICALFLCLLRSLLIRKQEQNNINNYQDPLYLISLVVLIIISIFPTVSYIVFKCLQKSMHKLKKPLYPLKKFDISTQYFFNQQKQGSEAYEWFKKIVNQKQKNPNSIIQQQQKISDIQNQIQAENKQILRLNQIMREPGISTQQCENLINKRSKHIQKLRTKMKIQKIRHKNKLIKTNLIVLEKQPHFQQTVNVLTGYLRQ